MSDKLNMKQLMGLLDWSRSKTAIQLDISVSAVDKRLSGKYKWKSLEVQHMLDNIEKAYGIKISSKQIKY